METEIEKLKERIRQLEFLNEHLLTTLEQYRNVLEKSNSKKSSLRDKMGPLRIVYNSSQMKPQPV